VTFDNEKDRKYQLLGHGVHLRLDDLGRPTEIVNGVVHYRFMDRLYLPVRTNELGVESIKVINRWREGLLERTESPHRSRVRRVATAFVDACNVTKLLEIGPGKFPLITGCTVRDYVALEVDDEAKRYNLANGLRCVSDPTLLKPEAHCIDTVVALFSMQFHMSAETFELLAGTRSDAVFLINVSTSDEQLVQTRVWQIEQTGATITAFDLSPAGAHDVLLVVGHRDAGSRLHQAIRAIMTEMAKEWPNLF